MLRCRDVVAQADAYLAMELSPWRRAGYRAHLLVCRYCRRYLHHIRLTQQVSRTMPAAPEPAPERVDALVELLLRQAPD